MKPLFRGALTVGVVLIAVVIGLALRTLVAYGVFTSVTPGFAGTCRAIASPFGPEDIAIDETSGLAFVSAMDRRAFAAGKPSPGDGLYALPLNDPMHLVKLAGTPADFHPHGISLTRDANGGLVLFAINHRPDGTSAIDEFDVALKPAVALRETGSIAGGELVSPNAIAAVDPAHFYVANDHGSRTSFGRVLDDVLVLPRANILYFDGMTFRVVAMGLSFPSGLALSRDGRFLYASETFARRIDAFSRSPISGVLEEKATLDIPSGVDNLRLDAKGDLWVGSHPRALAMADFRADPHAPAPSEIYEVSLVNDLPTAALPVFVDDGHRIGGASVAAVSGKTMLIGSPLDDKILHCAMR